MIKKTLTITLLLSLSLFANNTNEKIDLNNTDIIIVDKELSIVEEKTKKDYEVKIDFFKPEIKKYEKTTYKKENDITIDGGVDFNKSDKTIDGAQLKLGTKF